MGLRESSWRLRATLGVVAAIAAVPVGYALAQATEGTGEGTGVGDANGTLPVKKSIPTSEIPSRSPIPRGMNQVGTADLPPQLVERCRDDLNPQGDCGLVRAIVEGRIPPGLYTDAELEDAVAAAGYRWTAAPDLPGYL
jgi:hypothetical protein